MIRFIKTESTIAIRMNALDIDTMKDELKKEHVKNIKEMWSKFEDEMRNYFQENHLHYTNAMFSWIFAFVKQVMERVEKE